MKKRISPSKKLGQHFLKDKNILRKIVDAANLSKEEEVLEIGPGLGSLTEMLLENAKRVIAVEKDKKLFQYLKEKFSDNANLELYNNDILDIKFSTFFKGRKLKLISNLPYNISSQIIIKALEERDIFLSVVIMIQKEMGERITSKPGKKTYGSLSILLQTFFEIEKILEVSPHVFYPKPKIHSVVLRMIPKETYLERIADEKTFKKIIRQSFSSRRKTIKNALLSYYPLKHIEEALGKADIEKKRRAETLNIEEAINLANQFYYISQSTKLESNSS